MVFDVLSVWKFSIPMQIQKLFRHAFGSVETTLLEISQKILPTQVLGSIDFQFK